MPYNCPSAFYYTLNNELLRFVYTIDIKIKIIIDDISRSSNKNGRKADEHKVPATYVRTNITVCKHRHHYTIHKKKLCKRNEKKTWPTYEFYKRSKKFQQENFV